MEGLGRATSIATESFATTLDRAYHKAESGRSFIIVTPYVDEDWQSELQKLQEISAAPICILTPDMLKDNEEVANA